jgi:membrane-associated protease RseP (regulator of RpoE activity)
MDIYTLSVFFFFGFLLLLIYKDRKNIEIQGLLLVRKTSFGLKLLDRLAKPVFFWKLLGTVGIFFVVFLMFEGIVSLIKYGNLLLTGAVRMPGVSFIFPSPKPQVESGPGYILMPFWFWLIIIMSVLLPHETFHGIMSRVERIRIKTAGFLLLVILPGAFVEPDEKKLKRSKLGSKLRVFAAGSLANFLVFFLVFYLTSSIIWPYFVPGPIMLAEVNETGPAREAGLRAGMVITEINGKPVKATYSEFLSGLSYLLDETKDLRPGDEISILANGTYYKVKLSANPENKTLPYLGIVYSPVVVSKGIPIELLFQLLTWVWIINYAISVFNIMPIYPLDGGLIVQAIAEKISKKYANKATYAITIFMLLLLAFNFFAPFVLQATPLPS